MAQTPLGGEGFSFATPTEFVELPSRGQFYPEGHPLHDCEVVEIKHMTAKEEDILTSEALLKNGLALIRLLESVLINKSIEPESLLIGDKNAILIAVRQTGFGNIYNTSMNCPACNTLNEKDFSLENKEIKESVLRDNVELLESGNFLFHDTEHDLEIEIKLLRGKDETRITQSIERLKKLKKDPGSVTTMLQNIIVNVNGMKEPAAIRQVVNAMPVSLSRRIRNIYEEAMPNINMYADFDCSSCSHVDRLEVPINLNFFWPEL
tara:strand:- start:2621 stop:3412 length:792 start_codon:yes stop_codon:yes gene_type:complete